MNRITFFKNYDLYDNPSGPGEGLFSNLNKYKSVEDFIKKKKKRRKKIEARRNLFKLAFDFPLDDQITNITNTQDDGLSFLAGLGDKYFETHDFEDKTPDDLTYARPEGFDKDVKDIDYNEFIGIISQLINAPNDALIGLPDGLKSDEVDATETNSNSLYKNIQETFPSYSIVY